MFDPMLALAKQVIEHAYVPYSHFKVGACLLAEDGQFFVGCNVENVSYGLTQCAEASAIGGLIASGNRQIKEAVIVCYGDQPCPPCGACRQRLAEFANESAPVHMCCIAPDGAVHHETLAMGALLPSSFNEDFLPRQHGE